MGQVIPYRKETPCRAIHRIRALCVRAALVVLPCRVTSPVPPCVGPLRFPRRRRGFLARAGRRSLSLAVFLVTGSRVAAVPAGCRPLRPRRSLGCGFSRLFGSPASWPYVLGYSWLSASLTVRRSAFPARRFVACHLATRSLSYLPHWWLVWTCPTLVHPVHVVCDVTVPVVPFHIANPSFGIGNGCDATYPVDTNFHTFTTVWTSGGIKQYIDNVLETTCNQSLVQPMFLIIQIQTGGVGDYPKRFLPAGKSCRRLREGHPTVSSRITLSRTPQFPSQFLNRNQSRTENNELLNQRPSATLADVTRDCANV